MKNIKYKKAYVLFSGGLDSYVCAHMMSRYGFDVELLTFKSLFFLRGLKPGVSDVEVGEYKLKQNIIDVTDEYFEVLEDPKYGYGKNINPCIDCKILFLKKTKELMVRNDVNVVATGEVLGQRPKSQRSGPLKNIMIDSGLEKHLIRPLCISQMPKSFLEDIEVVDRGVFEKMIQVHGRSRKNQLRYVKEHNIKGYSSPSGGCLLTHKEYCRKLRPILKNRIRDKSLLSLLKTGRHFMLREEPFSVAISGRNQEENEMIQEINKENVLLRLNMDDIPGPLTMVYPKYSEDYIIEKAAIIHIYYSDYPHDEGIVNLIDINSDKEYTIKYNREKALKLIESIKSE